MDFETIQYVLTVIIASMIFSFAIAFPIIHLLYKFNITRRMTVDFTTVIEERNSKIGVPIMGGLIIIVTVICINLVFNPQRFNEGTLLLLFILAVSAVLGGFDDVLNIYGKDRNNQRALSRTLRLIRVHKSLKKRIWMVVTLPWEVYKRFFYILGSNPGKGIQAHEKIIVQSIAGLALGIGIFFYSSRENPGNIAIPFIGETLNLGFLIIPFAWIAVLLMTNAVNLADGMDGLAASQLLASFLGFLIIAIYKDDLRVIFLTATVIGSLISYLYFNVPPARFQMGDVGSLSIGALLAAIAFMLGEPLMLLFISLPFTITLLSAVVQGIGRRILGRRIFRMAPIHYHLQMKNSWSEEKVVMRLGLLSIFCTILGLWIFFIDKF
jgi:UDP-N-acetylmuramyl pentapeptide phosphotransferase/UDP-N-acetylglucosamine-1-phosphate transferase